MLGDWRVVGELGRGAMGIVYEAVHPIIGKRGALKILRSDIANNPEVVERFVREARSANCISHPNIIDVFAFGVLPDGRHYFVMEYLEGECLAACLERQGRLSLSSALPLLRQVASALDAAHERGIIHRDLKPDNIYLAQRAHGPPTVKVLDFGIAKLTDESAWITQAGAIMGTPLFMSPEQCRGEEVDFTTDVYALGVVAYRMLTGRFPVESDTVAGVIFQQISSVPRPPSAYGAPAELDAVLAKALCKNPEGRHRSLTEMVDELAALGGGDPTVVDAAWGNVTPLATSPVPRFEACAAASAPTSAAPLVESGPVSTQRLRRQGGAGDGKRKRADGSAQVAEPDDRQWCRGHRGAVSKAAYAADGSVIVSVGDDHTVRLWKPTGDALVTLRGHTDKVEHLALAEKGHLMVSGGVDGQVLVWSVFSSSPLQRYQHRDAITALSVSADGSQVVSGSADGSVRTCHVPTGRVRSLRGHSAAVRSLACSTDGEWVASGGDDRHVRLWNRSGESRVLYGHTRTVSALSFRHDDQMIASASHDGSVREWNTAGECVARFRVDRGVLRTVVYSPTGRVLAAAGSDGVVSVGRTESGRFAELKGHKTRVRDLAFSADGRWLASASTDGNVRIWDALTKSCHVTESRDFGVRTIAFSPDGRALVCAGAHGQMLISAVRRRRQRVSNRVTDSTSAIRTRRRGRRTKILACVAAVVVSVGGASTLWLL